MNTASIRPSTVDGIKNLAKKIKREKNISHTEALDVASKQAGFETFVHARKALSAAIAQGLFPVYLSIHWYDRRSGAINGSAVNDGAIGGAPRLHRGREVLQMNLSRPLPLVVAKHRVARARGLEAFVMEYVDHLEHPTLAESQASARGYLVKAERCLRFMEASKLQPVNLQTHKERLRVLDYLPGHDHTSCWFDPESNAVAMLDEPYKEALVHRAAERTQWLFEHGFSEVRLPWDGLHRPGKTVQMLVSDDQALLDRVAKAVAGLAPDAMPNPWVIETAVMGDAFVSPTRSSDGKARRPIPRASYATRNGATPYGGGFGIRSRWRPLRTMSPELHMELGAIFMQLDGAKLRAKVDDQLRVHFRSRLEDWANIEHNGSDVGYEAYYGQQHLRYFDSKAKNLAGLARAKAIVEEGYNDCKPRRDLLAAINAFSNGIKSLP